MRGKHQNGLRRGRDEGRSNRRADFVMIILPRPPASRWVTSLQACPAWPPSVPHISVEPACPMRGPRMSAEEAVFVHGGVDFVGTYSSTRRIALRDRSQSYWCFINRPTSHMFPSSRRTRARIGRDRNAVVANAPANCDPFLGHHRVERV